MDSLLQKKYRQFHQGRGTTEWLPFVLNNIVGICCIENSLRDNAGEKLIETTGSCL